MVKNGECRCFLDIGKRSMPQIQSVWIAFSSSSIMMAEFFMDSGVHFFFALGKPKMYLHS